jgi:hypothetical protein
MAGGVGRAQGGYDEMVFRAMVKDRAHFYDPLGLASEGTKIDFPDRGEFVPLRRAVHDVARVPAHAGAGRAVARPQAGSRAYYASQFQQVFGTSLERAWAQWLEFEQTFQQANLDAIRKFPLTPYRDLSARALGSVSRALYDARTKTIYAAFNYPGVVAHVGSISTSTGETSHLTDIKGPLIYQVTSLAMDPAGPTLFYTTDNLSYRDLVALDVKTGTRQVLMKDARIGDLVFSPTDRALWGIRHLNGLCTLVELAPPYHEWKRVVTFPYGTIVYDLDVSPDGTRLSASFGEIDGKQNVRVMRVDKLRAGRRDARGRVRLRSERARQLRLLARWQVPLWQRVLHGRVEHLPVRAGDGKGRGRVQRRDRILPADPARRRRADRVSVHRPGLVPSRITAKPIDDVNPITFLGERTFEKHPELKTWALGSPADVPLDSMPKTEGVYRLGGNLERESFYPIVQGYKDTWAVGMRYNVSDPLQFNRANVSVSYSPSGDLRARNSARPGRVPALRLAGARVVQRRRLLRSVRSYAGQPQGLLDRPRPYEHVDLRRAAPHDARNQGPRRRQSRSAAGVPERAGQSRSAREFSATLRNTFVRSSLGHVDDERGRVWTAELDGDYVNSSMFFRAHATYDVGLATPLGHSSVWLRNAVGFSPDDRAEPFANFFFGAFGNNYVDHGDAKRYRGSAVSRSGHQRDRRPEFRADDDRVEPAADAVQTGGHAGRLLSWLRPALFASGLLTNWTARPTAARQAVRRSSRFAVHGAVGARHDRLGRRRGADGGRRAGAARGHGVARRAEVIRVCRDCS